MKKVLYFAAAAMVLFAGCQKTEVVYDNDGPQEIALFAVNKVATKAPVEGTDFTGNDMRVSAYLYESDNELESKDHYFSNILFTKGTNTWTGGQYWPLSKVSMNFMAVTLGGKEGLNTTDNVSFNEDDDAFTVILNHNIQTPSTNPNPAETWNQPDLMYATGNGSNLGNGSNASAIDMVFNHALAWVNFAFKANTANITINSVSLNAHYNGTFTVQATGFDANTFEVTPSWANKETEFEKLVPEENYTAMNTDWAGDKDATEYDAFGGGLLVVPSNLTGDNPYFVINYTVTQSTAAGQTEDRKYQYKHPLTNTIWEAGKKYTYNINISLNEIEVAPSVTEWDTDINSDEEENDDISVNLG